MGRKRGNFNGRKRGRGRRETRRPARVVNPGLFYALRAVVKLMLHMLAVRKLTPEGEKALADKLELWLDEANAWGQAGVLRTRGEARTRLPVHPGETSSHPVRHGRTQLIRKPGRLPAWPSETTFSSVEDLDDADGLDRRSVESLSPDDGDE